MIEFCRDNLDILMVGVVAVIVLILLVSGIKCYKNKDDDEELELNEAELMEIVEQVKQLQDGGAVIEPDKQVEVVLPPLTARIMADEELQVMEITLPPLTATIVEVVDDEDTGVDAVDVETTVETVDVETIDDKEVVETAIETATDKAVVLQDQEPLEEKEQIINKAEDKAVTTIQSLVDEIATISGTGVEQVEIKVPGAQVKITYLKEGQPLETNRDKDPIQREDPYIEPEKPLGATEQRNYNQSEEAVIPSEKGNFKYGPDNINVARSGRVYSEEELQQQIRD